MTRYFFNIVDGDRMIPDEEGMELQDAVAALREAQAGALDMVRDAYAAGEDITHQVIEIIAGDGQPVTSIRVRDAVERRRVSELHLAGQR